MSGSAVVFVGRVLVESGADWGPARVAVEEGLFNVPKDLREVEIDTFAGSSCYRHIEAGERYVIFAGRSSDGKLFVALCSWTFRVLGNEHILSALRNQREGGSSRLLGTVRRISDANADE
jgi:hypothetical protein